jgi:hypothetical protein
MQSSATRGRNQVVKKGQGCNHLYLLSLCEGKRKYRCCDLRFGCLFKHWRCVGTSDKQCPLNLNRVSSSARGELKGESDGTIKGSD